MPVLELQTQAAAPPAPPRKPPKVVSAEPFERPSCRNHSNVNLSDEEIKKGFKLCSDCRRNEAAMRIAMKETGAPKNDTKMRTAHMETVRSKEKEKVGALGKGDLRKKKAKRSKNST